jgi:hypothetical protein
MSNTLEMAVKQPLTLKVSGKEYLVEFPLAAVIQAEAKLGRSLKTPADWLCAPAADIPVLLAAGLVKHHPDVTPEEIKAISDGLDPESINEFTEALGALAFPKWLARYKESLTKLQEAKGVSPNAASADAS